MIDARAPFVITASHGLGITYQILISTEVEPLREL